MHIYFHTCQTRCKQMKNKLKQILNRFMVLFGGLSLKTKIILSMVLISLVPTIIIGAIANINAFNIVDKQLTIYSMNLLNQMNSNIEGLINNADKVSLQIMARSEVQNYYINKSDRMVYNLNYMELKNYLSAIKATNTNIISIYVCLKNLGIISPDTFNNKQKDGFYNFQVYKSGIESTDIAAITGLHENEFMTHENKHKYVMTLSRAAFSSNSTEAVGAIIINISPNAVLNACKTAGAGDRLYIIDHSGKIIYSPDSSEYEKILDKPYTNTVINSKEKSGFTEVDVDGSEKNVRYLYSPKTDWFYISEIDIKDTNVQSWRTIGLSVLIIIISVLFTVLMSLFFATSLTKPIKKLVKSINHAEKGDFSKKIAVASNDEIGILTANYNNMLQEIENLLEKVKEENRQKRQSDINFLQAQITPHFIYNFLNTIKVISRAHQDEKIHRLTSGLIELLHTSINRKTVFITVEEEINLVTNYLYLQQVRYDDKFEVIYEIDDDVLKLKTLKMLLQPIVENSVIHGINLDKGNGILIIRAYLKQGNLCFEIEDNGRGMSDEEIHKILNLQYTASSRMFSGIGIKNIHDRIDMYFGSDYTITFKSRVGYGTKVILTLPVINDESECEQYV